MILRLHLRYQITENSFLVLASWCMAVPNTAVMPFDSDIERGSLCFTDAQNSIKQHAVFAKTGNSQKVSLPHSVYQWAAGGAASALNQYAKFGTFRERKGSDPHTR